MKPNIFALLCKFAVVFVAWCVCSIRIRYYRAVGWLLARATHWMRNR